MANPRGPIYICITLVYYIWLFATEQQTVWTNTGGENVMCEFKGLKGMVGGGLQYSAAVSSEVIVLLHGRELSD